MENILARRGFEHRLPAIGVDSLMELMLYLPHRYIDYTRPCQVLRDVMLGEQAYFVLRPLSGPTVTEGPPMRLSFWAEDATHEPVKITVFGGLFAWENQVRPGAELHVAGRLDRWRDELQLNNPVLVGVRERGRVLPVYRGKPHVLSSDLLRDKIQEQLPALAPLAAADILRRLEMDEASLLRQCPLEFASLEEVFYAIHRPASLALAHQGLAAARRLSAWQIVRNSRRPQDATAQAALPVDWAYADQLARRLPFALTADQKQALHDILDDLRQPHCMRRLLSGDIGSGKTAVYAVAAVAARQAGGSVAILMPNSLLAEQVRAELAGWYPEVPLVLLTAGTRAAIDPAAGAILIGTTALLHAVNRQHPGWCPAFLVIDEQQKMSREQREALVGRRTHVLEVTATCIPRTAALVTHGAMEVSLIRHCPVQKEVQSRIVQADGKAQLFQHLRELVAAGGQVAVIYPEVSSEADKKSVEAAGQMWQRLFPGQVALLHGRMPAADKAATLTRMKQGEVAILVSTTVIEVGVTIPALRALVVVHAERYGVTTLHQLRGRVARLGGSGWFYLYLPQPVEAASLERLQLVESCQDGFQLAEQDMRMRGFGDLSQASSRQTGQARTLFVNLELMPDDLERCLQATGLHPAAGTG